MCAVARDFEDVDLSAVGSRPELVVEAFAFVAGADRLEDEGGDEGLRVPVAEAVLDLGKFIVGIDGA